jgi:hypothetical protein
MIKPLVIGTAVLLLSGCMQPYANIKTDTRIWSPRTEPKQAPQPSQAPSTVKTTSPGATPPAATTTQKAMRPASAAKPQSQTAKSAPVIKMLTPVDTTAVRSRPVSISVE